MDTRTAHDWQPPEHWQRLTVIDSHTGGEPFRVVVDGLEDIPGETVLDRRRYAQEHLDGLRRALMWEPRGHTDMYGGWPGSPTRPDSDLSVLFTHNDGFSTMCGHGIVALTKVVIEMGIVTDPGGWLRIDTPAGQVSARPTIQKDVVTSTTFRNVPSFTTALDETIVLPDVGEVVFDIAFGGAFYALVDASQLGLTLDSGRELSAAGRALKQAISRQADIEHPVEADLGFLYGVIFIGPPLQDRSHSRNVCVFADGEVDRSPTGTGVSARLAALHARGLAEVGETIVVESIVGSTFSGRIVQTASVGSLSAVVPEIEGTAHLLGRSEFWIDPDDPLGGGFLVG